MSDEIGGGTKVRSRDVAVKATEHTHYLSSRREALRGFSATHRLWQNGQIRQRFFHLDFDIDMSGREISFLMSKRQH